MTVLRFIPPENMGPLVGVGIFDAYAGRFEYRKGNWAHENTGMGYGLHPTHPDIRFGHYTDDTQMSIAVGECMLDTEGLIFTKARFDEKFRECYQRDKRAGYSRGMIGALDKAEAEGLPLDTVCTLFGKSEKSGAAMRATPLGLLPLVAHSRALAEVQGAVTHQRTALEAASVAAMAAHYMLYKVGKRVHLLDWIAERVKNPIWSKPWMGPVGSPGMESTRAALTAVVQATSQHDLLIRCVAFTGDVDTVAAIAMGCAWAYEDLASDLPYALWEGLENGPYGRDYMHALDRKLLTKYRPHLLAA